MNSIPHRGPLFTGAGGAGVAGGECVITTYLDPAVSKEGKLNLVSKALHPKFEKMLAIVAALSEEKGYAPLNWLDRSEEHTS